MATTGDRKRSSTASRFGKLARAEQHLIAACSAGEDADLGLFRPNKKDASNSVRAELVRFLALGGDDDTPVREAGVNLRGAWLVGVLDLDDADVPRPLSLTNCVIERIDARRAHLRTLNLHGSRLLEGLNGDALRSEGPVFLREGFSAAGEVRLASAQIGVTLDCSAGLFENPGATALQLDGALIAGDLNLSHTRVRGEVRLIAAEIKGGLECHGSDLHHPTGDALIANRASIRRVCLRERFHASGAVRLEDATVSGNVTCSGGAFDHGSSGACPNGSARDETVSQIALSFRGSRIAGALVLKGVGRIDGMFDLSDLHVGRLADDPDSWSAAQGQLLLDGFVYDRFADAPSDAESRITWLAGQYPGYLGHSFRSQPWEQLIKVLRSAGLPEEARTVAIEKQTRLRRAGKVVRGLRALHWLYGATVGYGYRPLRLLLMILSVWLSCAGAYAIAHSNFPSYMVRTERSFGPLDSLVYSADVLLPVVDLGHAAEWRIKVDPPGGSLRWGKALRLLYWLEIAFGWFASAMLASAAATLIKKD